MNKRYIIESEHHKFDVIYLTDTALDQSGNDADIQFDDYILYRRDRDCDSYVGICVYISRSILSKRTKHT